MVATARQTHPSDDLSVKADPRTADKNPQDAPAKAAPKAADKKPQNAPA